MWLRVNNVHEKYEIAYHSYPEAKRAHQVQNFFVQIVRSVKTTAHDQTDNIPGYFCILRRKKVQSPAKQLKELFSLCPNHFRWNGIAVYEL